MRSQLPSTFSVRFRWFLIPSILCSLMLSLSLPASSQCALDEDKTPARGAPSQLWGELAPFDTGQLPNPRDNTDWNQIGDFETHPYAISLDVEQNWVFLAQNRRFQIWNASTLPGSFNVPQFDIGLRSMETAGLIYTDSGHSFFVFEDIDAPPNNSNVVALVGVDGMGMAVYNTTNKSAPQLTYQDHGGGRYAKQVYVTTISGQHYAFVAAPQATALPGGVFAYNLSTALAVPSPPCIEARPTGAANCPNVYLGKLGSRTNARFIDGAGNFVAFSSTFSPDGVEIWDVAAPSNPQQVMNALTSEPVYGVAMWQQGSSHFLALRTTNQARIYDVSCISSGSCNLGSPLWTQTINTGGNERTVTFSRSGSTPFIYYGSSQECLSGNQNEWLFDVSNPSSPNDISPQGTTVINGEAVSYWGWYYWDNGVHGFNRTAPRMGKFSGDYFFRAGYAIFDVHRRTSGSPPNASFSWSPTLIYPDTPINFTDTSSGAPTAWDWDFLTDGVPGSSSQQNPNGVRFPTVGNKTVNLDVTNPAGSDNTSMNLQVLAPEPTVSSVSVAPNPALICQPVTFTAQGVTGQPPLNFAWEVKNNQGATVATGTVNPFVWTSAPADQGDSPFTAEVTVTNSSDSAMATSPSLTLNPLSPLPQSGTFTPVIVGENPPTGASVEFMVTAAGATEWNWNFGDNPGGGPNNDGYEGWTSDPSDGPNPTHVYGSIGTYQVRVKVRNCVESEQESAALSVQIVNVVPVTAGFEPVLFCQAGSCFADVNEPITFNDTSTGPPSFWDYDWDGNSTFEDNNNTSPVTTHTYTSTGNFTPRLRVRLNGQTDIYTLPFVIRVESGGGGGGGDPPRITVSGPTTGNINQNLTFTASASDCTATSNGWVWTANGATGSSTTSSIQLSWPTSGNKVVTARNSNSSCGTASDSHIIAISGGGGGGGGTDPVANFTFTPPAPVEDQSVDFDARSSTGNPTGFSWTFGDGTSGSGDTISHVFQNPGTYQVTLEVTRQDSGCTFGICSDETTRTVVVTSSGPPPVVARYTVDTFCGGTSGQEVCDVDAGQEINFTDTSTGPVTSRQWNFGDGSTSTAANPSHTYTGGGSFVATLTVSGATNQDMASRTFNVTGPPEPEGNVIVPWVVTQNNEALVQTSALYVHNPDRVSRQITMRFHRRRASSDDSTPPESVQTLAAGATAFFPDVLQGEFGLSNVSGFLELEVDGDDPELPTAVSYQRTFPGNGQMFGHAVPEVTPNGFPTSSSEGGTTLHLMGLNDNDERLAFFGVANPNPTPSRFQLRFFNQLGESIGVTPPSMVVGSFNQRQFEVSLIRNSFGLTDVSDYRIDLEVLTNGPLYMYGANLRLQTEDPSYLRPGEPGAAKVYLLGVLATGGLNDSLFRTDGLLSNVTGSPVQAQITYTPVGLGSESLPPASLSLQPGETLRLANVLQEQFGLNDNNNLGYLTIESAGVNGVFPLVQGESYDTANPSGRFGQSMPALTEDHIGEVGERHILTGLQQDAQSRSTIWLMNPGTVRGEYDLIYRNLNGAEVGRISAYRVPRGGMRQLNPEFHPLPGGTVEGGFTVQVIIRTGSLLSGAQVVDNDTNDPAFVAGVRR
ncbi:MAG: PKD domain-containing protein [Deltaproteobacteria bacterium]|nr:PKD domain-containing protein [Deltaproteobacteria bacterium]